MRLSLVALLMLVPGIGPALAQDCDRHEGTREGIGCAKAVISVVPRQQAAQTMARFLYGNQAREATTGTYCIGNKCYVYKENIK